MRPGEFASGAQSMRCRSHQSAAARSTAASPAKIVVSIPWKSQKRLAGW